MKRDPSDIAKQIADVVPKEYKSNLEWFSTQFKNLNDNVCFETLQTFLYKIIGPIPKEDWHYKALSILTKQSLKDIKRFAKKLKKKANKIKKK